MRVEVRDDHSKIFYIENDEKVCTLESPIGMSHLVKNNFSTRSANDFMSYFFFCLHSLKNIREIPETFYIETSDNKIWFENIFSKNNYTQFFARDISPRVMISINTETHPNYERYKKTLNKFKI